MTINRIDLFSPNFEDDLEVNALQYNKSKHLELLKELKNGTLNENSECDLIVFSSLFANRLLWECRSEILELIQKFLNDEVDIYNFKKNFAKYRNKIRKIVKNLKSEGVLVSPNLFSTKFGHWLGKRLAFIVKLI